MGKTSLVLNVAINVASPQELESAHDPNERWQEPGYGVVIFSLEMPREQIVNRMLCSEARVDVSRVRTGMLAPSDWSKLTQAAAHLDSAQRLGRRHARRCRSSSCGRRCGASRPSSTAPTTATGEKKQRIGLVVVDYLQLMRGREDANSREQEISEISRGLKQLAKELSLPVIALSQLNRAVETRGEKSKRPQLSDLRESGRHRAGRRQHLLHLPRRLLQQGDAPTRSVAELIIAKQRNGPTDTVKVRFDAQYTRFDNLAEGEYRTKTE